jgi:osmotically-inducible protein OsmY
MYPLITNTNLFVYSDASILADIREAFHQNETIRAIDEESLSVSVKDGFVLLTGHLRRQSHRQTIEEIACSTPGVVCVHNELVADSDLTIQVAERLCEDERTRHHIFLVGSAHGWVRVGGVVPRRKLQLAAEEIAAEVPFVRGILSRPRVIGEGFEPERRAIQPLIQAKVFDYNLQEGVVTQVVIQPRNRLVTHAVVSSPGFCDGNFVFHEYLVPVEAMEVVKKESIFLKRSGPPLDAFAAFEPSDYTLAPLSWRPPYPYTAGTVLWPCASSETVAVRPARIPYELSPLSEAMEKRS